MIIMGRSISLSFNIFRLKGRGFESRSSRHVGTLGIVRHSQLAVALRLETPKHSTVLCRERLWVVVDLKKRYRNSLNEWMNDNYGACILTRVCSLQRSTRGWRMERSRIFVRRWRNKWTRSHTARTCWAWSGDAGLKMRPKDQISTRSRLSSKESISK